MKHKWKRMLGYAVSLSMIFSLGSAWLMPVLAQEEIQEEETTGQETQNPENQDNEGVEGETPEEVTEDPAEEEVTETETETEVDTQSDEEENEEDQVENPVAKIGDDQYETLDKAVEEAPEGSTIELLRDCELTKGFNKSLTFTGTGTITTNKQLTSNGEGWMCFGLYDPSRVLTLDGVTWNWNSEVGTAPWLMLSLSGTLNVTNGATLNMTVDSGATGSRNAIYMNAGSKINVSNGSTFKIQGYGTAGKEGQGLQLDKNGTANVNVTGGSTFIIDGTNRGYVNSPSIYVENSTFTVQNCTANASNGGNFTAVDSTINYLNNAGHGLSAGTVEILNSTATFKNNGYYGVYASSGFHVDGKSTLNVVENSNGGDFAGLKITSGVSNGLVEAGATVNIQNNYCSGLSNNGKLTFEEGVNLTITGNKNDKGTTSNGGGIYNSGASAVLTLPSNTIIHNNHAKTAGDDIFNNTTSTITFGNIGAANNWFLDGEDEIKEFSTCSDLITGWFDDSNGSRWQAHGDTEEENHISQFAEFDKESGMTTKTGALALKAAHDNETFTITINYIDEDTGEKITQDIISNVPKGNSYDVTDQANRQFDGYTYIRTEGELKADHIEKDVVINVYYKKNASTTPEDTKDPGKDSGTTTKGENTGLSMSLPLAGAFGTMSVALLGMIALVRRKK